tara:strand:+ start:1129 stop:2436 length:1308 start_codon:yes stop_codon:yes gene_type:complete
VDLYWGSQGGQWEVCGPEARFVYECLASRAARNEHGSYDVKGLARSLRVSQKLVSDAVVELVAVGAIVRTDAKTGGKGRPAIRLEIAPLLLQQIEAMDSPYGIHSDILERLFSEAEIIASVPSQSIKAKVDVKPARDRRSAPSGARGRLSAPNRLLLGRLLVNADKFGVVSSVSNVQLRRLTGLDDASLKHRLRRLMDLGFIRRFVSGLTSSIFKSGKVSSTYVLNLTHHSFGISSGCDVLKHVAIAHKTAHYSDAQMLQNHVEIFIVTGRYWRKGSPVPVVKFLAGQNERVFAVIQVKLCQYVSYLLTNHWMDLGNGRPVAKETVIDLISGDFRQPNHNCKWSAILYHFYERAIEIAEDFKARFSQVPNFEFAAVEICIIPPALHQDYKTITMAVWQPREGATRYIESQDGPLSSGEESPSGWGTIRHWPCQSD